jgi:cell division protein FtsW
VQKRFVFINMFVLVAAVVALTALGIVMLTSTGAFAQEAKGAPFKLLEQQLFGVGVGLVLCVAAALIDYRALQKYWWVFYLGAALLLVCCFVPGIGKNINGSSRWIHYGTKTFQPSELGKIAGVIALAWWYARSETVAKSFLRGFVVPLALVGGLIAFILPEVDLGTSALLGCATLLVMFVAGTRFSYIVLLAIGGAAGLCLEIQRHPERAGRVMAFLAPDKYPADAYQQMQGLVSLGSGGFGGRGLGNGMQKFGYLPFAHTDFVFPTVGEELGLLFTLGVVFCFLLILVTGTIIAMRASDRFGKLLGFGIVSLLALQAILNMGVTTMLLPNKGLPLPFISYGGSNIAFCLASIGILISIYRQGFGEERNPNTAFFAVKAKAKRMRAPRI